MDFKKLGRVLGGGYRALPVIEYSDKDGKTQLASTDAEKAEAFNYAYSDVR